MRITFGIIVLNGEPFVRYNLRALYPFAHQIIVVEGAALSAATIATSDGHSRDGTLSALRTFKSEEDPEDKIMVVCAEDEGHENGFWIGEKHEMSQAYAKRATGDWLWQVDIDEFYHPNDMKRVIQMLDDQPGITQVSFRVKTYFGSPNYLVDSVYLREGANAFRRLFAWGLGYRYVSHRPPTVVDGIGQDLATRASISAEVMARRGIYLHHYEQLFPKQVQEKCAYYARVDWSRELREVEDWAKNCYLTLHHPYRVHMVYRYPSWIERNFGQIPPMVSQMIEDIKQRQYPGIALRQTGDIEELLDSPAYSIGRAVLKIYADLYSAYRRGRHFVGKQIQERWLVAMRFLIARIVFWRLWI